jgi:hypothetical protein
VQFERRTEASAQARLLRPDCNKLKAICSDSACYPWDVLAREVAELRCEKTQLLEENASLKKGLDFMLGRYVSPDDCNSCRLSCPLDEQ